jgi:hypothetical protein
MSQQEVTFGCVLQRQLIRMILLVTAMDNEISVTFLKILPFILVPALTHTAAPTVDLPHGAVRPDVVLAKCMGVEHTSHSCTCMSHTTQVYLLPPQHQ